ncbi:hypothetical protein [Asanoa siamensis]|uniref:Polyketide cyclase/dehydrase/lipid transport protein n=1 Tax=Asanoa siamensis TaxID=926357 RepID=A0ABQ4CXR0_9ACTN|nr:hypothetical protein [Asanoa siamensis]GIF75788.1 hypothetical protein Asi02nite_53060 [Asanoa siamensis]
MGVRRELGMSAEPEVVYNTATDPARASAWLPEALHRTAPRMAPGLSASWHQVGGVWQADLVVQDEPAGGAVAVLTLAADGLEEPALAEIAERALTDLDREAEEAFTGG